MINAQKQHTTDSISDCRQDSEGLKAPVFNRTLGICALTRSDCKQNVSKRVRFDDADRLSIANEILNLRRECQALRKRIRIDDDLTIRLIIAEATVASVKAGLIDPDAFKILDFDSVGINSKGEITGLQEAIDNAQQSKPYLFNGGWK